MNKLLNKVRAFTEPRVNRLRCIKLFVAAVVASSAMPIWSCAAILTVSGTMTSITDFDNDFRIGDQFDYSFTFDDQAVDAGPETHRGLFSASVSAFSLTRNSANAGTWNPASGSFTVSPVRNFTINANGEEITIQAGGVGFPKVGGSPFLDVYLAFKWIGGYGTNSAGTNIMRDFVDTGSGQTFADMVGISPLDFSSARGFVYGQIRGGPYSGPYFNLTVDRTRVAAAPSTRFQRITRTPTNATIHFNGVVGNVYTVWRSGAATGTYANVGTATVQPDGTATFTDNAPLADAAFYRISHP